MAQSTSITPNYFVVNGYKDPLRAFEVLRSYLPSLEGMQRSVIRGVKKIIINCAEEGAKGLDLALDRLTTGSGTLDFVGGAREDREDGNSIDKGLYAHTRRAMEEREEREGSHY